MTVEEVESRVRRIDAMSNDDESAHEEEDELHRDVITYIAEGGFGKASELAAAALRTQDIEFSRWCA